MSGKKPWETRAFYIKRTYSGSSATYLLPSLEKIAAGGGANFA
jgi:hypothetical protein